MRYLRCPTCRLRSWILWAQGRRPVLKILSRWFSNSAWCLFSCFRGSLTGLWWVQESRFIPFTNRLYWILLDHSVRIWLKCIWHLEPMLECRQYVPPSRSWYLLHDSKPLRHLTTKRLCQAPDFRQRAGLDSRPPSSYRTCGQAWWMLHALNQELRFICFSLKDGWDQEVVTLHLRIEWCIISTHSNSFQLISTHFPSFAHLAVEGPRRNAWDLGALAQIQ